MHYPVRHPSDWDRFKVPAGRDRIALFFRELKFRRHAMDARAIRLDPVAGGGRPRPLAPGEIPLICVQRNSLKSIDLFLRHYRALGVGRFIFVDDGSDDGTPERLAREPDVDVFVSNVGYRQCAGGLVWRDMLIGFYGRNRWYVSVDADEFLVYSDCETRPLRAFVDRLATVRSKRCLAPMLDLYPDASLGDAGAEASDPTRPTDVSPMLDGSGYTAVIDKYCVSIRGGPRRRLFETEIRLTKYPLLYADRWTAYNGGRIHGPLPLHRNYGPVDAVLLHLKFTADSMREFQAIVARGTHFAGSRHYKRILDSEQFSERLDLRYEDSFRFSDSADLVRRGLLRQV